MKEKVNRVVGMYYVVDTETALNPETSNLFCHCSKSGLYRAYLFLPQELLLR